MQVVFICYQLAGRTTTVRVRSRQELQQRNAGSALSDVLSHPCLRQRACSWRDGARAASALWSAHHPLSAAAGAPAPAPAPGSAPTTCSRNRQRLQCPVGGPCGEVRAAVGKPFGRHTRMAIPMPRAGGRGGEGAALPSQLVPAGSSDPRGPNAWPLARSPCCSHDGHDVGGDNSVCTLQCAQLLRGHPAVRTYRVGAAELPGALGACHAWHDVGWHTM